MEIRLPFSDVMGEIENIFHSSHSFIYSFIDCKVY